MDEQAVEVVKVKIRIELDAAKVEGRTRTELLQAIRVSSGVLAQALTSLQSAFEITAQVTRKHQFALGRPVTRYWLTQFAPQGLTPLPPSAIDIPPTTESAPPSGRTCRQCGVAIPRRGAGPVPHYCSDACARLANAGGVTVVDFLSRASNPLVFARCARALVEIDLLCRGFEVTPSTAGGGFLLVYDRSGSGIALHVVPISDSGQVPDLSEYPCAACVYRDGRIVYGGKFSLVNESETREDADNEM